MAGSNAVTNRQRLDSWKEIAVFFGRDERTVNRWEKELGLPVHRLPGTKGRVYAYADELAAWLATSRNARTVLPSSAPSPERALTVAARPEPVPDADSAATALPRPLSARVVTAPEGGPSWLVVGTLILLAVLALILLYPPRQTFENKPRESAGSAEMSRGVVQASSHAHNPEAEQLYLKGRFYWNKRTPDDLNKAVDYFVQAIVHDPNYASAYVGLADCYNLLREYTAMPAAEAYARAFAAAKKAVELDDQSSSAHASLAFVLFYGEWDVANAELEFRRAIDLDPNNAVAHHWYATYLLTLRRLPESLAEIERAQALDPASTSILADKGDILFHAGRRDEAITLLKQMEATDPGFRSPHLYLRTFYLAEGDYPDFLVESRKDALLLRDNVALATTAAAEKGFTRGDPKPMFLSMLQTQKRYYSQKLISPTLVAETCALLGNKGEALQYLKAAYDQHDELILSVQDFPAFDSLRETPGYRDLLNRMNLPVEN